MIGLGIFFIFLPIVAVILRVWAKLLGPRGIVGDDVLIFFGLLGQHQSTTSTGQPLLNDPRFALYEKVSDFGFTKSSFLLFYMSIFTTKRFRICAQVVLGIVVAWTVSFFFANLFTCYPISPFIEAFYGNNCVNGLALWYAMAISDIIVDFFIILLPIPVVLKLQLVSAACPRWTSIFE
ncbi:MAG: hypothetical protein LQ350_002789 [Teloschistes chrysophthalmus]|nr:MAG: hypothetical protein LQ350_002789 [Niorma chrysophthalma]